MQPPIETAAPLETVLPEMSLSTRLQFALGLALIESITTSDEAYSAIAVNIADALAENMQPKHVTMVQQAVTSYLAYVDANVRIKPVVS